MAKLTSKQKKHKRDWNKKNAQRHYEESLQKIKNSSAKCSTCGVKLTKRNWQLAHMKIQAYVCKKCNYKDALNSRRKTLLVTTINGKVVRIFGLHKRPHRDKCEICNRVKKLSYHHWDDSNYSKGMWICTYCHYRAEAIDRNFHIKYFKLKKKIEREVK